MIIIFEIRHFSNSDSIKTAFIPIQMSATCKHDYFVRLTMGDNPVTVLPGIGRGNQKALRKEGYYKACQVFGRFLILDMSETKFKEWLVNVCGADTKSQTACYDGLKEWYNRNFNKSFV
ncbi:barrier-to-autointegration factor-like [Crassostrea angulata]|uniref:barrier-to-autointegration factor-like n=1 Tax=Magallana angulata TaxID=2784310 RepID=UPI0022B21474|nr:barrier-to-autointegration factor-like [Crassostrea angulata]